MTPRMTGPPQLTTKAKDKSPRPRWRLVCLPPDLCPTHPINTQMPQTALGGFYFNVPGIASQMS